jgi:hypothetical protein
MWFFDLTQPERVPKAVMVTYLSRLFHEVEAEEAVVETPHHILSIAALLYYLHSSHDLTLPLTEDKTRATWLPCELWAIIAPVNAEVPSCDRRRPHLSTKRCDYCYEKFIKRDIFLLHHGDVFMNYAMIVNNLGLLVSHYAVVATGEDPLGAPLVAI